MISSRKKKRKRKKKIIVLSSPYQSSPEALASFWMPFYMINKLYSPPSWRVESCSKQKLHSLEKVNVFLYCTNRTTAYRNNQWSTMCLLSDWGTEAHMTAFIKGLMGQYMSNGQNFIQAQMISSSSHTSVLNTPAQAPPCFQTLTLDLFFYLEISEEMRAHLLSQSTTAKCLP